MTTVTLQPDGTSGIDTTLISGSPTTNFGTDTTIVVGHSAALAVSRALLKFSGLSDGTSPPTSTVVSATLSLTPVADNSNNARTVRVFRPKRAWVEAQTTWNVYSTGNSWQTAGGFGANDCEQTDIGNRSVGAAETLNTALDWTLTASAIQAIVNGTWTNNGFLIKADTEELDAYNYASSDHATVAYRPKLVVVYAEVFGAMLWS